MVKSIKKLLKGTWRKLLVSAYVLYTVVAPLSSVQNIALAADTFCVGVTPGCVADLQTAITAAADGDTINIEAGTFNPTSTINVNKSLTIVGAGVDSTIIDASGYAGYGMNITASGVSLSGFTFTGANHYGLKISNASSIALTNLKVTNSARTNIDFNGVDNVTVNNVISSGAVSGTGLSITDGENYTISNLTTSGNAWASIALYTSHWYAPAGINNVSLTNHTYGEAVGLYSEVENVGDPITNINVYPEFAYSVANSAAPKVVVYYPAAAYTTAWFVAGNTVMDLSDNSQIYPDITAPSVPVLTWPVDGAYTNDNTPLMQWDDSTDLFGIAGYYYRVYFNCSDLNNPATCTSVWPSATGLWRATSEYQAGTTANNTFYWQVMAQDNSGNQSAWSGLEKLVIDTVAPAKVTLVSPLNNSFANGASLTNSWNPVADAASYVYESYHNEALTNVRWSLTTTDTSKTATNVAEATFWWRVRAVDAAGNLGEWSDAWKVTVDNTGPVAPVIVTPVEGDAFNSAPILNDWTDVTDQAGISKYRIQYEYDDLHPFSGAPYRETAGNVSQRSHVPAVSEEGGVKFRVQAFDGVGNEGTWSEWVHYYYDLTAPITVFYTPVDGDAQNVPFEVTGYTEDAVGVSQTMLYYSVAGENNWVLIDTSAELMNLSGSKTFDWAYNWTPSTNGTFDLMAKAYDTAGNLESTAYIYGLVYDTVKPLAAITAPVTGLLTNSGITVLGTASDELSGVAKVEIRFRNTDTGVICKEAGANRRPAAYDDMTGTWSYDYPAAQCPDGAYQVTAFVTDNAGNERAVNVNVVLDTTAPAQPTWGTIWNRTNSAEITCGGYTNTTQIKLDWNANTESDLVGYWFGTKNNDHHAYVTVDYYDGNMTPGNNPYYYTVIAVDAAGNESLISNQCGVTLDQDAPSTPRFVNTAVLTRLGDLPHSGDEVRTSMKFSQSTDATTSVARYEYQFVRMNLDGVKLQSGSVADISGFMGGFTCAAGICTWNPNTQNNSQWIFRLRSVDMAGNMSAWSNWDDATNAQFSNLTATYANYENGTGIFARADYNGSAGNQSFIVRENVAPVSEITAPTGAYSTNNPNITIDYSASDYGTEVKSVALFNNSDVLVATNTTGQFNVTLPYVDGSYCFYTSAQDVADDASRDLGLGNVEAAPAGKCELEVLLDVTAPVAGEIQFMADFDPFLFGNGFVVRAPVSDSFSGVDTSTCEFTFDNGTTWETGSYAMGNCVILKSTPDNEVLTVNVRVMDNVGNSVVGTPKTRISDSANPTSTVIIDDVYSGPNVFNAMTIKGVADDSTSNVEALRIMIKGSNNRYYNGTSFSCTFCMLPQMLSVSTATLPDWNYAGLNPSVLVNGRTYVVTPTARDSVYHISTGTADSFIWDNVAPLNPTGFTSTHDTPNNVNSITVNWPTVGVPGSASDALSGVKGYSVAWSMNALDTADTIMDLDATQTSAVSGPAGDGVWYLHIRTVDNVMNWSDSVAVGPYVIDTVAPVTTVTGIDADWHNTPVTLTFACTDVSGSGCDSTYYSLNGAAFVELNPFDLSVEISTEGENYVRFYSVDVAGNVEVTNEPAQSVKIDMTNPTNPSVFNSEPVVNISTQDNTVKVWWNIEAQEFEALSAEASVDTMITAPTMTGAYDELSGVSQFQYSFTATETDLVEETDMLTSDPEGFSAALADGLWYFHMRTQDVAGNWSDTAHFGPFVIDNTKPVITRIGADIQITQGQVYTDQGATASDVQDGNITTSVVVTNPVNTTVLGSYVVRYNVSDSAGNVADEVTRNVVVVAAPVVPAVVPQGDVQGAQDEEVVPAEETPVEDGDVKGETCTEVKLFGYVYVDENNNGKFDKNEQIFENVTVKVMGSKGKLVEELETNKDGMWEIMLCTGKYSVEVSKDTIEDGYKAVKGSYDVTLTEDENELNVSFELVEQKNLLDYWWILLLALLVLVGGAYGYKKFRDSK